MDLTETVAPKSDQLNADDLMPGPRTFTVEKVARGSSEQPVNIHLVEVPGRPYRPSKSMRRVIIAAWGKEGELYVGRQFTLYRNPKTTFGPKVVGGIEISHMSHIDRPITTPLTVRRGQKEDHTVQPIVQRQAPAADAAATGRNWYEEAQAMNGDRDSLYALYMDAQATGASPEVLAGIQGMVTPGQPNG